MYTHKLKILHPNDSPLHGKTKQKHCDLGALRHHLGVSLVAITV